jgi:hypothetical protein
MACWKDHRVGLDVVEEREIYTFVENRTMVVQPIAQCHCTVCAVLFGVWTEGWLRYRLQHPYWGRFCVFCRESLAWRSSWFNLVIISLQGSFFLYSSAFLFVLRRTTAMKIITVRLCSHSLRHAGGLERGPQPCSKQFSITSKLIRGEIMKKV